jgi:thiosulfate/3-mercaptopyruvate sulfurtransferase
MKSIVSVSELSELLQQDEVLMIDARSGLQARADYLKQHISGSVFVDLETELSDRKPDAKEGGRHPLPSISRFCELLSQIGLTADSKIVVYDDKCGANAAARFWWMVRAVGHRSVAVLDGGLQAAVEAGLPVESGPVARTQSSFCYSTQSWLWLVSTLKDVEVASQTGKPTIIDVRENYRYRGESEPIDLVAGHIPGAINVPYLENLTDKGFFLDPVSLGDRYRGIGKGQAPGSTIVHCGSGVSACQTILAMEFAGLPVPSLFVGSWSEWSRNPLPIAVANAS